MFGKVVKIFFLLGLIEGTLGKLDPRISGDQNPRVVGGLKADIPYPYQLSLQMISNGLLSTRYDHFCGGAIIDEHYFLTAGHCLQNQTEAKISVLAGTNKLHDGGSRHSIDLCVIHPEYDGLENDIAICRVKVPFVFNETIGKIDLNKDYINEGINCTLTGWGSILIIRWLPIPFYNLIAYPEDLRVVNLTTISASDCKKRVDSNDNQLCTFTKFGQGACAGDSGGPLVCNGALAGIVSFGTYVCSVGFPDGYTRISSYYDWIISQTVLSADSASKDPSLLSLIETFPSDFQGM